MRFGLLLAFLFLFSNPSFSQDTVYARQVIKFLTSKKCYGRGYLKNGLKVAARYIVDELKLQNTEPLLASGYYQLFRFNVNTFPGKVKLKIDGKKLTPGSDFIISPESRGINGTFSVQKKDSVTYLSQTKETPLLLQLKKKLTASVAQEAADYCQIEVLTKSDYANIRSVEVNIENKLVKDFPNNNLCAFIPGKYNNDSMIVFSAHYDHLGGIGKRTFFPGGNDNASGVSVLLNLAKYYKTHPPKYKTLFLFFAGEEAGLVGSHYFTKSNTIDLKKIKFLINLDLLATGDDGIMVVNGTIHEKEIALLTNINTEQQLVKEIKKRGKAKNSDHYWFSEAGVPCFFIYTLGGVTYYHDVLDKAETLPLSDYTDVMKLITSFVERL